jgi:NAD(P)-dependent dehydrogenase (short-subunit alcohol dehydrogenase family)
MTPVQQTVGMRKLGDGLPGPAVTCHRLFMRARAALRLSADDRNSDSARLCGRKVMAVVFDERVAIVTGAGSGLGRCHALGLAARGAKVVVNDLGRNGAPSESALKVVEEIRAAGGKAIADPADVADFEQVSAMAARAEAEWRRVDILVNNAGVLRDKSFAKMEMTDFEYVVRVHLIGSANCAKAVWNGMRERNYGRVVLTSSASGIYGNFGQSNYGAAKAGLIGLMNVLSLEGAKNDIRVNILAPTARTAMTEGLLPPAAAELMAPETVTPAVLFLASDEAPSRVILGAGAGSFAVTHIAETPGVYLDDAERTPETIAARWAEISDPATARPLRDAFGQTQKFVAAAAKAKGVSTGW